jgi:exonuclease III
MRLVSWNLAHQCREDPISPQFFEAVRLLAPDVISLNEYVHGPSRREMIESLAHLGLRHLEVSHRQNNHNQVLVASRFPLERGELTGPLTANLGGESNFLHVRIPAFGVQLVGVRVPSYTGKALHDYWIKFVHIVQSCAGRPIVFMGDLNTDPEQPRRVTAKYLLQLESQGWSIPRPEGSWSFISKTGISTRIDHAVVAGALPVTGARYVATAGSVWLAAPNRLDAVSDHAPLVLDLAAGAA